MGGEAKPGKGRRFGHVYARLDRDGRPRAYTARYVYRKRTGTATFPTRAQAVAWLDGERDLVERDRRGEAVWTKPTDRRLAALAAAPDPSAAPPARMGPDTLFSDYCDEWLRTHRRRDGAPVRVRTRQNLRYMVSALKRGFPPATRMRDMTPALIREWYDGNDGGRPVMFRCCCQVLKRLLRDAADPDREGGPLLADNPFRMPVPPRTRAATYDAPPVTPEQLTGLYDAFPARLRASVLLAALAGGLRLGEVCALRAADVDLDERVLYVRHSVEYSPETETWTTCPPKTRKSHRTAPLPRRLVPVLAGHIREYCPTPDSFLFPSALDPARPISPRALGKAMRAARARVGRGDLTFQMLRASHATLFMMQGGTLRETMDQLGHDTQEVAIRHYQRIVPEHRRATAERLAELMLSAMPAGDGFAPPVEEEAGPECDDGEARYVLETLRARIAALERLILEAMPDAGAVAATA